MSRLRVHWLWLLLLVPVALGLWRLRFDVEVLNLLPDESPVVQGLKLYQQNFANARELIITLNTREAGLAESSARAIALALRARPDLVAEATWTPPWLERPDQAAELIAYLWLNQTPEALADLTRRLAGESLTNTLIESREALATSFSPNDLAMRGYDPLGLTRLPESGGSGSTSGFGSGSEFFSSADGTFRLVFAEAVNELASYKACAKWLAEVKRVVEAARSPDAFPPEVVVRYTGRPAFVAEIGSGMERDLAGPSVGTLVVIALLFYFAHRRWKPLFWLLALLVIILAGTLALGGLVYGTLSVVSLGFASILLGLAEDFGIVLYQESRTHPHLSLAELRHEAAPGIFWSAITTAGAFLLLNFGGLPGLGQLGTLVAIGVGLAAFVMLYAYLPPLLEKSVTRPAPGAQGESKASSPQWFALGPAAMHKPAEPRSERVTSRAAWLVTTLLVLAGAFQLWRTPPHFDQSPDALRPKNSAAYAALDEIKTQLNRPQDPLWIVIAGDNESSVARRLAEAELILQRAASNQVIAGFTLPSSLWPATARQSTNKATALALAERKAALRDATMSAGFSESSFGMAESIFRIWQQAAGTTNTFWPTNENSRWVLEKVMARTERQLLAIGLVHLPPGGVQNSFPALVELEASLRRDGVLLSGWELMGPSISKLVRGDLQKVLLPIVGLVLVTLWLAFHSWRDVLLSFITIAFSLLGVHLVMTFAGWSWNMMNLMALPLLLGMGVDFSIHMQLALRRHGGDLALVRRSVGRALLLAGSTTVAGFASLSFASNAGIAGLGKICAVGIVCAMLSAVYLLPVWWQRTVGNQQRNS